MALFFPGAVGAQQVPEALQASASEQLVVQVHAKGEQIYSCKVDGTEAGWTQKGPEAQLFDNDGKAFRKHFAGPSSPAATGSRPRRATALYPPRDCHHSLPTKVGSRSGEGVLARVTSIQRINTKGGKAPVSGCDAEHAGREVRVVYSADYLFFAPK